MLAKYKVICIWLHVTLVFSKEKYSVVTKQKKKEKKKVVAGTGALD